MICGRENETRISDNVVSTCTYARAINLIISIYNLKHATILVGIFFFFIYNLEIYLFFLIHILPDVNDDDFFLFGRLRKKKRKTRSFRRVKYIVRVFRCLSVAIYTRVCVCVYGRHSDIFYAY